MDDGEQEERAAAEAMQRSREWFFKAERAGAAGDRLTRLMALTEALNASGAAIAAIEIRVGAGYV